MKYNYNLPFEIKVWNLGIKEAMRCDKRFMWWIGAVIFCPKNKIIISSGHSHYTLRSPYLMQAPICYPSYVPGLISIHAEAHAAYQSEFDQKVLRGKSIFIYGRTKRGSLCKTKPCKNCRNLLFFMGIRDVYFLEKDGSISQLRIR